ncbi:GSCOCG00012112001-RA-CDS [Cotesia congregata]|nr:GSCOCG00012112001-RA-CDS [Cotesia congregata]
MFSSDVHLELVTDYTAAAFIAAYRRFTSRRGICHTLYSDCGTNFVGADKELKRLFAAGSRTLRELSSLIAQDGTNWKFNPPRAPHFGGKWEAAVKSIKFHLRRTIGDSLLTLEQYSTLLAQIEAILNSRPLTPLNEDPADLAPSLTDLQPARLSNWEQVQQMVQHLWKRYYQDCIHRYQAISKWHHQHNLIKVGSVVLITTEDLPPTKWPLAKVIAVHPGEDGQIRVVTVKTDKTRFFKFSNCYNF